MRYMGGAVAMAINRPGFALSGAMRNIAEGEASIASETNRNGYPSGVTHPAAWVLPQKAGGITSRYNIAGAGDVTDGNLAGGLYGESTIVCSGVLTEASLSALGNVIAAISGSGYVSSADIIGNIEAAATLLGVGDLTGALISLLNGSATLTGAGDLVGGATGGLEAAAILTGAGDLAGLIAGVVEALAVISGSGTIVPSDIVGVMNAVATLIGMGDIDGAITALGHAEALLEGAGEVSSAQPFAQGSLSATITAQGDVLTAQSVAQAVMDYSVESGYSFEQVTRLIAAVLAGKTDIVDNGNGTATITFRNLSDNGDAAVFGMEGSERVSRS